jgi:hypothetical protein
VNVSRLTDSINSVSVTTGISSSVRYVDTISGSAGTWTTGDVLPIQTVGAINVNSAQTSPGGGTVNRSIDLSLAVRDRTLLMHLLVHVLRTVCDLCGAALITVPHGRLFLAQSPNKFYWKLTWLLLCPIEISGIIFRKYITFTTCCKMHKLFYVKNWSESDHTALCLTHISKQPKPCS